MASSADKSCAVCLTVAQDPRRVPCGNGHVFCLSCLQGLVTHAKNVQGGSFPCPCCRNPVNVPPGGVASFPPATEAGSLDPPQPTQGHHARPSAGFLPFPHGDRFPRPGQAGHAGRGPFGFWRYGPMGPPGVPFPPFPGPPRRMNRRLVPAAHDLAMDSPNNDQDQRPQPSPSMPFDHFRRGVARPSALPSAQSEAQPSLSAAAREPSRQDPRHGTTAQGGRGDRRRLPAAEGGGARGLASPSDDLDMDEVMLVIAQMEQAETNRMEREQDGMLALQNDINEQEDLQEALSAP